MTKEEAFTKVVNELNLIDIERNERVYSTFNHFHKEFDEHSTNQDRLIYGAFNNFSKGSTDYNIFFDALCAYLHLQGKTILDCVTLIPHRFFYGCKGFMTGDGTTLSTTLYIPSNVRQIGKGAFQNATFVAITFMHDDRTEVLIGDSAFAFMPALKMLQLPLSIKNLPKFMCDSCPSLNKVVLPSSVEYVGFGCFDENTEIYCDASQKLRAPISYAEQLASQLVVK